LFAQRGGRHEKAKVKRQKAKEKTFLQFYISFFLDFYFLLFTFTFYFFSWGRQMKSSTDYSQEYQHAFSAYTLGNYEEAATIIDRLVEHYPDDPNARILKGHIYCYGLRQYDIAREQYELVPSLTDNAEFIDCANME
jgi:tetratricopeptide (TPR) repeat protein